MHGIFSHLGLRNSTVSQFYHLYLPGNHREALYLN